MISINEKISNPIAQFTPAYYKRAVRQYQLGNMRELLALVEQAVIDSHVSGCLDGRMEGFDKDWRISEKSPAAEDVKIKEFVETVFLNINMPDLFEDIFDAKLKKYSVLDYNWFLEKYKGENKQFFSPKIIDQKYFRYDVNGDKKLKIDWGNKLVPIPEDSAHIIEFRKNPILLSVLRDFILKEFGLESFASFLETFGEPFIFGTYPPGADPAFKAEVDAAIKSMASSSRGSGPEGSDVKIVETTRNSSDHDKFIDIADKGISITLLGHENAVSQSAGLQVGENLTSFKATRRKAMKDIRFIEEQIQQLIKKLVNQNFNTNRYPIYSMDKSEPINVTERLSVIQAAYDVGYKINPDEFAKLGLYKYEDQDVIQKQNIPLGY